MRKIILFITLIFSICIYANQFATTDDGRRVLLRDNWTWDFIGDMKANWITVQRMSGNGIANTETFKVDDGIYRINWEVHTDSNYFKGLTATIYDLNSNYILKFGDLANKTGSTYIYNKGTFYIEVNSIGSWIITVEKQLKNDNNEDNNDNCVEFSFSENTEKVLLFDNKNIYINKIKIVISDPWFKEDIIENKEKMFIVLKKYLETLTATKIDILSKEIDDSNSDFKKEIIDLIDKEILDDVDVIDDVIIKFDLE
jgi:hypothetical protein